MNPVKSLTKMVEGHRRVAPNGVYWECAAHNEGQECCLDKLLAAGFTFVPPTKS